GGWITETYSWHWLFLINILPGIMAATIAALLLPKSPMRLGEAKTLDVASLILMAIALAALEIALKEAPQRGWTSGLVAGLLILSVSSMGGFLKRTLRVSHPVVDLSAFTSRNFAVGCLLSFVLGMGLFGSVYLMPVFLAFVRGHNALQIGLIMLVTGVAQLCVAPVAVALEQRLDARFLSAAGFAVFATGLAMSAVQTPQTDYDAMFWPQVVRGVGIMFCLLPPTRLALGDMNLERVPDASGLFNLMRNLGGAIGLALIDTVIYSRTATHASDVTQKLTAGDVSTANFVGIPLDMFAAHRSGPMDALSQSLLTPMVEKAALTLAINDAWMMLAAVTAAVVICLPLCRKSHR
ncbi:MAG: DHA2 family efflux MFS transporter permease subunit, partial [Polaromonas sp.]|nr:DHA2 family efflux MFS transporter permease subunit [Polaromonas sp.]